MCLLLFIDVFVIVYRCVCYCLQMCMLLFTDVYVIVYRCVCYCLQMCLLLFTDVSGECTTVIAMPHRGRLNVLTCLLDFPLTAMFSKVWITKLKYIKVFNPLLIFR